MTDQQLCQSSERLLKLFLDESVTNKSISLQLWFNRAGKLQFRISTASSRRENRQTTASTDDEPVSAANRPPLRAPTRPQPTVTTRSISAANNKKRKTVPASSPTPEPSPELLRSASQQSQHALSFLDTNRKDRQSSEEVSSDEEEIPEIPENESVYTSPFFNKNRFQALSSPPTSKINAPDNHQPVVTSVSEGHIYVAPSICDICSKPHRRVAYKSTGSMNNGTWKQHEYWEDIEAFEPPKCLCFVENNCNCVHNERRNDVLPPKPVDV